MEAFFSYHREGLTTLGGNGTASDSSGLSKEGHGGDVRVESNPVY